MKKISKKNIFILIILIIFIIIQIRAFTNSRAKQFIDITADVIDNSSLLEDEKCQIQAINSGESGYYITLPDIINNKKVSKYFVEEKEIVSDEENAKNNKIERQVGEKLYLTEKEKEDQVLKLYVEYDKITKNEKTLYNRSEEKQIEDYKINLEGYMPNNSETKIEEANKEELKQKAKEYINETSNLKVAYDIKILSENEEFNPAKFEEKVKVTIDGLGKIDENKKKYKVIHIDGEKIEEISEIKINENGISFDAKSFSIYAVILEEIPTPEIVNLEHTSILKSVKSNLNTKNIWKGNVATKFAWGNGNENEPYLITNGDELAYLAKQVVGGEKYDGKYFQLTNDIDLGGLAWTPIGNTSNSFLGIFDGAGHVIANANINVTSLPNTTYDSYGIFGSLGGGNNKTIIRNVEFSNINVNITANGTTNRNSNAGIRIGCVAGSLYKNTNVENIIVKSSSITDTNAISVYNSNFQLSVGGIIGYIANTASSNTDPGSNARYNISNCFSNVNISLDATAQVSTSFWGGRDGRGHYHTGGIVGTIRSQPIWPTNCLYTGDISSNGFIGPIFGALINNTAFSKSSTFGTIWNGNDAGNVTMNNAYYSEFTAGGTSFTQTVKSGNSTARKNNTTTNTGYVQGVNKGIYTTNMNEMLNMFNNNVSTDNKYLSWVYQDNTFSLKSRLLTTVDETETDTGSDITINVSDPYNIGTYTYRWYKDDVEDTSVQGNVYHWKLNYENDENILVITSDGTYYATSKFIVKKVGVDIVFNVNKNNNSVTATLEGRGLQITSASDYNFQWYKIDIAGEEETLEGETSLILNNLEEGFEYKLVGTNTKHPNFSTQNSFIYGDRIVVYVDYNGGNDNNDGFTPQAPVKTLSTAYSKLDSNGSRNKNVIVIMGTYSSTSYMDTETSTTYSKNVTITGKYGGVDYNARLYFYSGTSTYRYMAADTTFQYLTFYGGNNQMYFYLQGYSLTMGEGVEMQGYATSNSNQGLIGSRAPALHIFGGWLRYNYSTLPRNNPKILIKSGTYGRIVLGGSSGNSSASSLQQTTSHNFTGSSMQDSLKSEITVDIKNSTTPSNYDYDINLLVGGSTAGNNYSRITENIKSGTVGRVLGGSIGDSSYRPNNWNYPINTFLGETTINVSGGKINELYGGCLGRNMSAIGGGWNTSTITCDSYFYGTINLNISGGEIESNIYGAGAGGVTGYSTTSSDTYKSYGENFETSVNLNISGGKISGNVYGGGYGYTEYLTEEVTATDGGALYGSSNIKISGSPTITGNIYAAGRGYNLSSKTSIAQTIGETNIEISGSPAITGQIFGAGEGISGYNDMAKLVGTSTIKISSDLNTEVYGGGNIATTQGNTNVNIENGNHTSDIYGGGNIGKIDGNTIVSINGGTQNRVYGGGNQADTTTSTVNINDGQTNEVYAGGNSAGVENANVYLKGGNVTTIYGGSNQTDTVKNSNIEATAGTVDTIYGGNNIGGTTEVSNVKINGSTVNTAVYGGGNQADTGETNVHLEKSQNTIPNVFGGGNQAGVTKTNVYANGMSVNNIFGGSNTNGTVNESNVTINKGTVPSVYGGNNQGGVTETSNVTINGGTVQDVYGGGDQATTNTSNVKTLGGVIENIYGGGNQAGVTTTNITTEAGKIENIYGGSNRSGDVNQSNISTNNTTDSIQNVYGGNNQGGKTSETQVNINGKGVVNVYGGGNQAVTNVTNLNINGEVTGSVYGGGNQAGVETSTNVKLENATIEKNIYGGGNEGIVTENTNVDVKNSTLKSSVYGGGNGSTAIVYGNTNLIIEGENTNITGNAFGGGNKAATGKEDTQTSKSTVNIVGATIGKNVYGGANTSVVYGTTQTNIGYEAVANTNLEIGNVEIGGTVFGGGEANESGSEIYDFSFISVTKGIDIEINGENHTKFAIKGSIFGSGNASSTSGKSYINIQNYGTTNAPQSNISIQRATCTTISNSAISLSGATDRTNEYSTTYFAISRVDEVKLKNNSTLYLCNGANLLKKLSSVVDENENEVKATVTIDEETGNTTKNVENRIYMLEGKNLNVATNEQVTAYGEVYGMTFLGLFTNRMNPSTSTGFYNSMYNNGDTITNAGTFSSNSYTMAQHMPDHDIKVDGFYTNLNENGTIKKQYIDTTPKDDVYYIWLVGEKMDVTKFEITLTASKYATLGTYELLLQGFSDQNIKFVLSGFSAGLDSNVSLVDPSEIEAIAPNQDTANNVFGLTMKTGNTGWQNKGQTTFLTKNGGSYTGENRYEGDNSTYTPTLNFCFYHSQNISQKRALGDVRIRLQAMIPIDDLNYKLSYIDIIIEMSTAMYQNDFYEAAITPGEEFGLFTTTETSITSKSSFSTYYSLYIDDFSNSKYYNEYQNDKRVIVSRDANNLPYVFPANTKLTMLDMVTNEYYYYVVTENDVSQNKYVYSLSDFILMGSNNKKYDEQARYNNYYNSNQDLIYENFIFHINFSDANLNTDIQNNSLLMELRSSEQQTLIGVLGIQRDAMVYSVYPNKDATIKVNSKVDPETVYLGDTFNLDVTTKFEQTVINSKVIYDTQYFDKKLGIKISIYDNNGNRLNSDSLLGINFELDGKLYYPRIDGTTRISIADKVTDVLAKIKVNTQNNTILATGDYIIKIESFGSSDGIYYGLTASDTAESNLRVIQLAYGLKVKTSDKSKIVDKKTGNTLNGNNFLSVALEYSSALSKPSIAVSLYRRDYSDIFSQDYQLVDLKDYVGNILTPTVREKEYLVSQEPTDSMTHSLSLNSNLTTGTYKLVYKLYDENEYVGEAYEYIVIK